MPTFEVTDCFWNDYDKLSPEEQNTMDEARRAFTRALREWEHAGCSGNPTFPKRLGVKQMRGYPGIWELAWAPDGRATWQFGDRRLPGKAHIIWRRVGSHAIYSDP